MAYCRNCQSTISYEDEGHASGCATAEIAARIRREDERDERAREYNRAHGTVEPPRTWQGAGLQMFTETALKMDEQAGLTFIREVYDGSPASITLYCVEYAVERKHYENWLKDLAAWDARHPVTP